MIGALILLVVARLQDVYADLAKAWQWAFGYAFLSSILSLSDGIVIFLFSVLILSLYAWGYFVLLRRFTDNLLLWILIYLGGAVLPVILSFLLAK